MATDFDATLNDALLHAEGVSVRWVNGAGLSKTVSIIRPINSGGVEGGGLVGFDADYFESGGSESQIAGIQQGDTIIVSSRERYTVASLKRDNTGWIDLVLERLQT